MPIVLIFEIKNRLKDPRQCINVYHHHTGIADVICFNQSISLSLRELTGTGQRDYLKISIEKEVVCSHCVYLIDVPSWIHFHLVLKGQADIGAAYSGDRRILKLSLAVDFWQIRIFRPAERDFSTIESVAIKDSPGQLSPLNKINTAGVMKNDGGSR